MDLVAPFIAMACSAALLRADAGASVPHTDAVATTGCRATVSTLQPCAMLPATPPEALERINDVERFLLGLDQVEVPTRHLIHAGMYARTIEMLPGVVLTGALMKRATLVIVAGSAVVLAGDDHPSDEDLPLGWSGCKWIELEGYNVIPASAGRKQVFVARSEVTITMVFPTRARTVEEAEAEFTDDAARLLSRRQDANTVVITGE